MTRRYGSHRRPDKPKPARSLRAGLGRLKALARFSNLPPPPIASFLRDLTHRRSCATLRRMPTWGAHLVSAEPTLFKEAAASDVLVGLPVKLPDRCHCGSTLASIKAGVGPHCAGLRCACGRHRGWMSAAAYNFLIETVKRFGRPTEPIQIRVPKTRMAAPPGGHVA